MKKVLVSVVGISLIVALGFGIRIAKTRGPYPEPIPTATAYLVPPSMINPEQEKYTEVNVGGFVVLVVDNAEKWTVEFADPDYFNFVKGGDQGTFETYPGLEALKEGKTKVTAIDGSGNRYEFTVNIRAKGTPLWGPEALTVEVAQAVIGKTESEAIDFINSKGGQVTYRVVKRDGEDFPVTTDYRLDRVNLEIENGIVINTSVG